MRPPWPPARNVRHAKEQGKLLLCHCLPGRRALVRHECRRAEEICAAIFKRFGVGPCAWRCHQVRWYLVGPLAALSPAGQRAFRRTLLLLLWRLERADDWCPHLPGPWRWGPTNEEAQGGRRRPSPHDRLLRRP